MSFALLRVSLSAASCSSLRLSLSSQLQIQLYNKGGTLSLGELVTSIVPPIWLIMDFGNGKPKTCSLGGTWSCCYPPWKMAQTAFPEIFQTYRSHYPLTTKVYLASPFTRWLSWDTFTRTCPFSGVYFTAFEIRLIRI